MSATKRSVVLLLAASSVYAQDGAPVPSIKNATWAEHASLYGKSALCGSDEITLWSCETRERRYALCSSVVVNRSSGYVQYRAVESGKATLTFPATRRPPLGNFTYASSANGDASVDFKNGGYTYSLVDPLRGNSSIFVTGPGESGPTSEIKCDSGNQTLQINYTMKLIYDAGLWSGH
jgi:hypothetical protein